MTGFTSAFDPKRAGYSPNRVDALVWALTDLLAAPMNSFAVYEIFRRQAEGNPIIPQRSLLDTYLEAKQRLAAGGSAFAPPDNRVEWRKRYDDMAARPTPHHPDTGGGEVEHLNGPLAKPTYAAGSLEYAELQKKGEP